MLILFPSWLVSFLKLKWCLSSVSKENWHELFCPQLSVKWHVSQQKCSDYISNSLNMWGDGGNCYIHVAQWFLHWTHTTHPPSISFFILEFLSGFKHFYLVPDTSPGIRTTRTMRWSQIELLSPNKGTDTSTLEFWFSTFSFLRQPGDLCT